MPTQAFLWDDKSLSDGRYRVVRLLGEGGMGFVYLAQDQNLDLDVVLKVPRPEMLDDPEFAARFRRENRSLVKLVHPNIVRILDVGEYDGIPFSVLAYLSGGDLEARCHNCSVMPPSSLLDWLPPIANALDYVHAHGYLHRDVKPSNILFDEHNHAYLSDFGIVKSLVDRETQLQTAKLTAKGIALGTPAYMAPELVMNEDCDGRVDQYALAATVFEILAGRCLFEDTNPATVLVHQARSQPPLLSDVNPGINSELSAVVMRALEKPPEARYATCVEFANAAIALCHDGAARKSARTNSSASSVTTIRNSLAETSEHLASALPRASVAASWLSNLARDSSSRTSNLESDSSVVPQSTAESGKASWHRPVIALVAMIVAAAVLRVLLDFLGRTITLLTDFLLTWGLFFLPIPILVAAWVAYRSRWTSRRSGRRNTQSSSSIADVEADSISGRGKESSSPDDVIGFLGTLSDPVPESQRTLPCPRQSTHADNDAQSPTLSGLDRPAAITVSRGRTSPLIRFFAVTLLICVELGGLYAFALAVIPARDPTVSVEPTAVEIRAAIPEATRRPEYDFTNQLGGRMIYIQPGRFRDTSGSWQTIEEPFWIAQDEITVAEYLHFLSVKHRDAYGNTSLPHLPVWMRQQSADHSADFTANGHPITGIDIDDAEAFCDWLSDDAPGSIRYRLPTKAEWTCAYRGGTEFRYYWGDRFDPSFANCYVATRDLVSSQVKLKIVGRHQSQVTAARHPWELHDIAGNVWEFVKDGRRFAIGGGSWKSRSETELSHHTKPLSDVRRFASDDIGFRIVAEVAHKGLESSERSSSW